MVKYFFTSESVAEGHPDKMCDQISDAIVDAMIEQDPESRCAVECFTKTGFVLVGGEVSTKAYVDIQQVVRDTVKGVGYDNPSFGFDGNSCGVLISLSEQSPDIAQGVNEGEGKEQGAGDQGMMFGYACNETKELMPLSITLAHNLVRRLKELRGKIDYLRPDGKSQVTVEYEDVVPKRVDSVVVSAQHNPLTPHSQIVFDITSRVIKPVCERWIDERTKFYVNPTGSLDVCSSDQIGRAHV